MSEKEEYLNNIFEKARTQPPEASFEEVSQRFQEHLISNTGSTTDTNIGTLFSGNLPFFASGFLAILIGLFFIIPAETSKEMKADTAEVQSPIKDGSKAEVLQKLSVIQPEQKNSRQTPESHETIPITTLEGSTEIKNDIITSAAPEMLIDSLFEIEKSPDLKKQTETSKITNRDAVNLRLPKTILRQPQPSSNCREVRYTITERTKEWELEKIARLAKQAGIKFWYQVHHQRFERKSELFLIRDMQIKMEIPDSEFVREIKVDVPRHEKFTFDFGWCENENGEAVSLTDNINISIADPKKKRKRKKN